MTHEEGKAKFIQAWGALGAHWGVSRTMAQMHALLLISPRELSVEEIRADLKISTGNANLNLRALVEWGLVFKQVKPGERKEFFTAEKDIWEVARKIIVQRKRKELEPVVKILEEISAVEAQTPESQELVKVVQDIRLFSGKADRLLETLLKADSDWFVRTFLKMVK